MATSLQVQETLKATGTRERRVDVTQKCTPITVLTILGTRPEAIKMAPIIHRLESAGGQFRTVNVNSSQHTDLLRPFIASFGIRIDHDLNVMSPEQTPSSVCARVLQSLEPILSRETPDLILVQGDTTTALGGALAGFYRRIPVGHIEAGLRSGNSESPYPEEMNRRLITRLASYHFAATRGNRKALLAEGVPSERIFVTGNPVVDSLNSVLKKAAVAPRIQELLDKTKGMRRIVLTTHRREAFGELMTENLRLLCNFVKQHEDIAMIFPVHPNPEVMRAAAQCCRLHDRVHLIEPLGYIDFVVLLSQSWLIVSDSGGVQEEAPTLRKPLLILRENTERPEVVEAGVGRLVGGSAKRLALMLEDTYRNGAWAEEVKNIPNPFGSGDASEQITNIILQLLAPAEVSADLQEVA